MSKIIIIGANHAGTACINTILAEKGNNEVVVYEANNNLSFLGCGMALWIGKQISNGDKLFYCDKETFEKNGATVHMETEISKIDFKAKKVYAKDKSGKEIIDSYDKLVLATGSLPIIPKIPGIDLENVQRVKIYQNAKEVIEKLKNPEIKKVTVVGAGYIGVELAEAFVRNGREVDLIDLADTVLSSYYDEEFSQAMKENLKENGVNLHLGQSVMEIIGDENNKVKAVKTDKGQYETDMVLMAIGFRPNTSLGKDDLELFRNGAYVVDKHQRTSVKDVYAIGDCATIFDNTIENKNYIALATNAVRSGLVAAFNILGKDVESLGVQGSNGICIFDLKMVSTGLSLKKAKKLGLDVECTDFEDLQKPEFMEHDNPKVKIRIVYDKKTRVILGAQMASHYDMSMGIHMFSLAIYKKVTIDELKLLDIFFLPHFNKPYNYITMAALGAK
ncbi:FAD-dependent oxidoreductase [Peptoniphilus lacrimalis]|uniref:H2O-forming NADH oxidase n=1 Tax=Peptoniphilus lacrimalis TaxID=33031 RepID=UPI00050F5402|nr:FAD-dependent oxidoreductase [Peptoniphilus lacrimalis]KGF33973.1 NADH oxidase [Peptoniphilus lacrimalis DNF00528]MDK7721783.1 FAD-dependent oxidoreductase [Peptoniphilus lacrimalis]MDK7731385.1 FAD-dependent oxidoreductase [Peptoniphilus lacrimalis]MDK8281205.1 FAD-dependent oxidoreductase [Peptoniphilus lacrimalis]